MTVGMLATSPSTVIAPVAEVVDGTVVAEGASILLGSGRRVVVVVAVPGLLVKTVTTYRHKTGLIPLRACTVAKGTSFSRGTPPKRKLSNPCLPNNQPLVIG